MFEARPWSHILNVGYLCGYFSKGMSSWGPLARGIICALQFVPVVLLSNSGNCVLFLTYLCKYWKTYLVDISLFCIRAWKLMPPTHPHPKVCLKIYWPTNIIVLHVYMNVNAQPHPTSLSWARQRSVCTKNTPNRSSVEPKGSLDLISPWTPSGFFLKKMGTLNTIGPQKFHHFFMESSISVGFLYDLGLPDFRLQTPSDPSLALSFNLVLTQPLLGPLPESSSKCSRSPSSFSSYGGMGDSWGIHGR